MNAIAELLRDNPDIWEKAGFYTFFLGILLLISILLPLLFEKERFLLPTIIVSFLLIGVMAWSFERQGPFIPWGDTEAPKVVYLTKTVEVPGAPPAYSDPRYRRERIPAPAAPPPRVSISGGPTGGRSEVVVRTEQPAQPTSQPVAQPSAPQPTPAEPRPVAEPVSRPAPQPVHQPAPQPTAQPVAARTEPAAPPAAPPPKRDPTPSQPEGERNEEGLVLPTGSLVIQITNTLIVVVPGEASRATMSITVDGRGVGGRQASSLRVQKDEAGNVLNVTYYWKGATIRMSNLTTGNHRVTVTLNVSGEGFKKSKTAWSGTVYVGEGATATIVLQGGSGDILQRVQ